MSRSAATNRYAKCSRPSPRSGRLMGWGVVETVRARPSHGSIRTTGRRCGAPAILKTILNTRVFGVASLWELVIKGQQALALANLPPLHGDRFGRLLLGQASTEELLKIGADLSLAACQNRCGSLQHEAHAAHGVDEGLEIGSLKLLAQVTDVNVQEIAITHPRFPPPVKQ